MSFSGPEIQPPKEPPPPPMFGENQRKKKPTQSQQPTYLGSEAIPKMGEFGSKTLLGQ